MRRFRERLLVAAKERAHNSFGLSLNKKSQKRDQEIIRTHLEKVDRWDQLVNVFGLAAVVFLSYVPESWMSRQSKPVFESLLNHFRGQREWLRETASKYLDKDAFDILFSLEAGTISIFHLY
jgi:aminopeptidase C